MDYKSLLKKDFIIYDGGFGTMLQSKGLKLGHNPNVLNITNPDVVADIHREYVNAGSDIICTNTFSANRYKLQDSGYSVKEVVSAAIDCCKRAVEGTDTLIALDMGPIGQLLEPNGTLSVEEAYDIFKEIVTSCDGYDVIAIETMTDLLEMKTALLACKENSDKPVLCTMSFEENGRTFQGVSPEAMVLTLEGIGADALGLNCSLGPDEIAPILKRICKKANVPVIAKPNAGLPDPVTNQYTMGADEFAEKLGELSSLGVKILGGCCGTTPEFISNLCEKLKAKRYVKNDVEYVTGVCSGTSVVEVNQPRIIGERINPTGKKLLKQALVNNDMDYILSQAISQADDGAEILDINVGHPEIDEKAMMIRVVKAVQGVVDLPLQLDSTKPEVLEAGLRVVNGRAIVNSVNGEEKSLSKILPIVAKYGAAVVGLTLDEDGIPETTEKRIEIAEKIISRAKAYGIREEDIYIDCLTLTVSAQQSGALQTLEALEEIKRRYKVKTVLGVSNISFGLPHRPLINQTFLTMALERGLDLPIINPGVFGMAGAVRAYRVLKGFDSESREYIEKYSDYVMEVAKEDNDMTLNQAVMKGLKKECRTITEELLKTASPMEIIDNELIPALDKVGELFEQGKVFLPGLLSSATAAQQAFELIKEVLSESNQNPVSKGKIILATVKGDIHDIGKNIVKVLLENYGYDVIDLGRDVEPALVAETAVRENVKLIGLSALMTTTLKSMEDTIAIIRQEKNLQDTRVMVGGAVLTQEYADKIGADYYCKTAAISVETAKEVFE
ncbi:MAG: homocysteine S-methyltransferase family protein [Oscillospiraceae bacterium]|nr:homocysteine S-methyltransferase family protein [Oscillospiraceae bacterium]